MIKISYRGIVSDRFNHLTKHLARKYATEFRAHEAAEKLCRRYFGARGRVRIEMLVEVTP